MIMKNKFLLIVLLAFVALQACVKDEEKVFDASAAERTTGAVNTLRNTLVAVPNGWAVEYYPELDRSMGGYHFIWKFDANGTVVVAGEQATANYPAGDTVRSYYDVIANRGVVLSFDTYNEVFHYFSEPHSSRDVDGYAGDYEFVLRESTPERIVLTGKKRGNRMEMMPYTGGDESTWKDYLAQFKVLDKKMGSTGYAVNVNDTAAAGFDLVTRKYRTFRFTYTNPDNDKIVPYITTPTGIKLYEPLTVDGETAQYFTFNETEGKLIGEGNHLTIELSPLPPNKFFATTPDYWEFVDWSTSVNTLISQCATNVYNGYGEVLQYILIGNSPLASYPGRGVVLGTDSYNAQFLYTFAPTGDDLAITYSGGGLNATYYSSYFAPLLNAITTKSPYSVALDNPDAPTAVTFTSVADPAFYFTVR
jgi:hypothetical protein